MARLTKDQIAAKIAGLVSHPALKPPKRVEDRLVGMGYSVTCSRCLGSGRYSYNQMDGDKCYGCGGSGSVAPKLTAELMARIEADVKDGALDRYAADMRRKAEVKLVAMAVEQRVDDAEKRCAWRLNFNAHMDERDKPFSYLSYDLYNWISRLTDVVRYLSWKAQGDRDRATRENAIANLARNADHYVRALEAIDGAWVAACNDGTIAADEEAHRQWEADGRVIQRQWAMFAASAKRAEEMALEAMAAVGTPEEIVTAMKAVKNR